MKNYIKLTDNQQHGPRSVVLKKIADLINDYIDVFNSINENLSVNGYSQDQIKKLDINQFVNDIISVLKKDLSQASKLNPLNLYDEFPPSYFENRNFEFEQTKRFVENTLAQLVSAAVCEKQA